jgi:hypothetical protein
MLNRMFFAQNVSSAAPVTYTPNTWYYNHWAVSHANFAPVGWHTITTTDCGNGSLLAYWNYYEESGLQSNLSSKFRSKTGWEGSLSPNLFIQWIDEVYGTLGRFVFRSGSSLYYRQDSDNADKRYGRSVILIKDDSNDSGSLTDYDGNVYQTIKIGNYVFTYTPWKCTHLNDGTIIPYVIPNDSWAALTDKGMCGLDTANEVFC